MVYEGYFSCTLYIYILYDCECEDMSEINQSREKNIYSITCTVKLVSLLFHL